VSCDDQDFCTTDILNGSAEECTAACQHTSIFLCADDDGCCPAGCDAGNDSDCPVVCGDGIVSPGETCDPPGTCPVSCDDADDCTNDTLTGDAQQCTADCIITPVVECVDGDGCCPLSCDASNDSDCCAAAGCVNDDGCCAPGCNAGNDNDCPA
jgi:hypothetical protein